MKNYKLYITDSAPNGTQDLLIVDENNEIIDSIQEATFGAPFNYRDEAGDLLGVIQGHCYISEVIKEDVECGDATLVAPIHIEQVMSYIACSPIDPEGHDVIKQLKQYKLIK